MIHDEFGLEHEILSKYIKIEDCDLTENYKKDTIELNFCWKIYLYIQKYLTSGLNEKQLEYLKEGYYLYNTSDDLILDYSYFNRFSENGSFLINVNQVTGTNSMFPITVKFEKRSYDKPLAIYDDGLKEIILPVVENNVFNLNTIKNTLNGRAKIIHELIHYVDDVKSNSNFSKEREKINPKEYFNSPSELNAFTKQIIFFISYYLQEPLSIRSGISKNQVCKSEYIKDLLEDNVFLSIEDLKNKHYKRLSQNDLYDYKQFYDNLTENNKKKLYKNIANYFCNVFDINDNRFEESYKYYISDEDLDKIYNTIML